MIKYTNDVIWPIIIIALVVFLVWSEDGSQNCRNKKCNNEPKRGRKEDNKEVLTDKILYNVRNNHTLVGWRRAVLASIIVALILIVVFCKGMISGFSLFILIVILFIGIYFASAWIQHIYKKIDFIIEDSLSDF
jgi:hypothetical protein